MDPILRQLERVARLGRALLVAERSALIAAASLLAIAAAVLADAALRLPGVVRMAILCGGLGWLAIAFRSRILPALRFHPRSVDLALRAELLDPQLAGRLASAVEFRESGLDRDNPLAAAAAERLAAEVAATPLPRLLRTQSLQRHAGALLLVAAAAGGAAAMLPQQALLGLERLVLPLGGARWPARTEVASLLADGSVLPAGRPVALAAELRKGDPARERVVAVVREFRDGRGGREEQLSMSRQADRRFERRFTAAGDEIEIRFRSADFESPPQRIRLVEPPAVLAAELSVEAPAYASAERPPQRFELGDGGDRRGRVAAPQLAGSAARLSILLNKPIAVPAGGEAVAEAARVALQGLPRDARVAADPSDPRRWVAAWTLSETVRIEPSLRDEHGLSAEAEPSFRVEVVEDAPPAVAIVEPASEEWVLPQAVVELAAEARDDLALAELAFEVAVGEAEATPLGGRDAARAARARFGESLSIESIGAAEGDRVAVVALASDHFERGGARRAPSRSEPRILRVVGREEFERRLREELAAVRQGAIRADAEQARLASEGDLSTAAQAAVTARLGSISAAVESAAQRVARNRLGDRGLGELLEEASARLEAAVEASREAEAGLRGAAADREAGDPEAAARAEAAEAEAAESRAEVREQLERLVSLLDRDEDAWAAMRRLERLAESLGSLREETLRLSEQTLGRSPQDLSAAEREALESIVARQREIGSEASEVVAEAQRSSERLESIDRARAEAMRQAAEIGRDSRVEESLREGASEAQENRLQQSAALQEQAQQGLERMRRRLEETRRIRTEMLRRLMTSLEESIEALLRTSEAESESLRGMLRLAEAAGLDERAEAVIRLERNTRSVAAEAASGGPEAAELARLVERAAERQGEAIVSLRRGASPLEEASEALERSSGLLREALGLAQRLREEAEREQQRERREALAAAYREIAASQAEIALSTAAAAEAVAAGALPMRRALLEGRRLGVGQESIRDRAEQLREESEGLADAAVFDRSHRWVEAWSREASQRLRDGDLAEATRRRQSLVAETLLAMAESLDDEDPQPEAFAGEEDGQSGGGGGGGGAGGEDALVPPISELRLLRRLQEQAYRRTRALDEAPPAGEAARQGELAEIVELQIEIRSLGESLLERLESRPQVSPAEPAGQAPISAAAPRRRGSPPGAAEPPRASPPSQPAPPSLDELLGIGEEDAERPAAEGADGAADRRRLGERLEERPAADDLREAIAAMSGSLDRLSQQGDAGLATQRLQEEAIRRLEALIANAERQRRPRPSSSSSSSSRRSQEPSPPPPSGRQRERGEGGSPPRPSPSSGQDGEGDPPPFEEAQLGRLLEEGRVEWGRLPERLRELVQQGRRDRISTPYRRWTEEYYRRLAEEVGP